MAIIVIKIKDEAVTKRPTVTKVVKSVTKLMGRPRTHETGADRQRAYRERKKANG